MTAFDGLADLLVREEWRPLPDPRPDAPLAAAAAALGAGEARRAIKVLNAATCADADERAVAAALRHAADAMEHNWLPGGGGAARPPEIAEPNLPATAPDAAEVVGLAHDLVARAPILRRIVDAALGTGDASTILDVLSRVEAQLAAATPRQVGPTALLLAGLRSRVGLPPDAALARARAAYEPDDAVGQAVCALAAADALLPGGRPETLGADLATDESAVPDPVAAPAGLDDAYRAVADRFAQVGAGRGIAAVGLRRSAIAVAAGDGAAARAHLAEAADLAGGDTALAQLVAVHAALLEIGLGASVDAAAVAGPVAEWADTIGSPGFVRGLTRLCLAVSRGSRGVRALRALALAAELTERLSDAPESDLVRVEWYRRVRLTRAAMALTRAELAERIAGYENLPGGDDLAWADVFVKAAELYPQAFDLVDVAALQVTRDALDWVAAHRPTQPARPELVEQVMTATDGLRADIAVFVPLYTARSLRDRGEPEAAAFAAEQAALRADDLEPGFFRVTGTASVLAVQGRYAEAADVVEAGVADGSVPLRAAAEMYVRMARRFDRAADALAQLPRDPLSWSDPALRAEVSHGLGHLDAATDDVTLAAQQFEEELSELADDVLRSSMLDTRPVGGLYATAVRIHAARAGTPQGGPDDLAAAFRYSDRARGMTLADVIDAEHDAGDENEREAVRVWQRAGAALARTIEEITAGRPTATPPRERLSAAQHALDVAEARLRATAPGVFAGRTRLPAQLSVAEVQERLAPGTLLLQYHPFDDQLVVFALTRDSARVHVADVVTSRLSGAVWRYHAAVRSPQSTTGELARGGDFATTLLGPVADELAAHERVVVVPYATLAMLPFHALPFGGGSLLDDHVVSYLPAVSAVLGRPPRTPAAGPALVLGGLTYAAAGDQRPLVPLPGTGVEARTVAQLHGATPLVDGQADRATVLERLRDAATVHLATHGELVDGAPYSAYLALSGNDRLTVPDLVGLGLRTPLAVLSACDSGRGGPAANGDVIGLTRALLGSGVDGLVVSLWPVHDGYATLLMIGFHERVADGVAPAVALAEASRELRSLTPADAVARYVALGGDAGVFTQRSTAARGPSAEPWEEPGPPAGDVPVGPAHPVNWAPFVHVGAP